MQIVHALLVFLVLGTLNSVDAVAVKSRRTSSRCQPFKTSFASSDVSRSWNSSFRVVSPERSYSTSDKGLQLFMEKPAGIVHTKDGVNDTVAEGATVNSMFYML